MTATFRANGFRPVTAEGAGEAAEIFANRMARREYGRNGYCRVLRLDSWSTSGRSWTYQAFIGKTVPGSNGTTSGHNVWLHVARD